MGKKGVQKLVFNEDSRREFITGFRKRKLARKKKAAEKFEQDLKEAKKQIKEKIRETYKKVIRPIATVNTDIEDANDTGYELPEHIVRVKELIPDEIAEQHNWIGRNRMCFLNEENQNIHDCESESGTDEKSIPGMSITSIKQVKKIVTNQANSLMQNSEVFKKKNKLEKLKNRKKAALRRNLLKKEQKKLKGRKRK